MIKELTSGRSESQLLLNHLITTFGPTVVTPLFYEGAVAGTEFLIYDATKLYLAIDFAVSSSLTSSVNSLNLIFYNQTNAAFFYYNGNAYFNTVSGVANYFLPNSSIQDFYFSRFVYSLTSINIKFLGYRLTY